MTTLRTETLRNLLWEKHEEAPDLSVYALLDAARRERVFELLVRHDPDYHCLFSGKLPRVLAKAAPYIVELDPEQEFTDAILEEGWGDAWGVFLTSDADLAELRKHFRRFLRVKDARTRRSMFFRYYDPRVLRIYLPTCTGEELSYVLDPVRTCLVESETGSQALLYALEHPVLHGEEVRLAVRTIDLPPAAESPGKST